MKKERRSIVENWEDVLDRVMKERGYARLDQFSLNELLELARGHEMTPSEKEKQRVSFAVGMIPFSNTTTTREDVEREARRHRLRHLSVAR